jgi:hypothetical protein
MDELWMNHSLLTNLLVDLSRSFWMSGFLLKWQRHGVCQAVFPVLLAHLGAAAAGKWPLSNN